MRERVMEAVRQLARRLGVKVIKIELVIEETVEPKLVTLVSQSVC